MSRVPSFQDVLCTIQFPSLQGSSDGQYKINERNYLDIQTVLTNSSIV